MDLISRLNTKQRRAIFVYESARIHAICSNCPVIPAKWKEREESDGEFAEQFVQLVDDLCFGRRELESAEAAHNSWVEKYRSMGWRYAKHYDAKNKLHPDLVSYAELDKREKIKDEVFLKLVNIAKDAIQ